ncbi:MAG: hypothetical protein WCA06_18355 [Terrimicrobiaceae bacterium]
MRKPALSAELKPSLIAITCPVTWEARSEHKKITASANSSGMRLDILEPRQCGRFGVSRSEISLGTTLAFPVDPWRRAEDGKDVFGPRPVDGRRVDVTRAPICSVV